LEPKAKKVKTEHEAEIEPNAGKAEIQHRVKREPNISVQVDFENNLASYNYPNCTYP